MSQLFWYNVARFPSKRKRVPGKRSSKYCAPTWSWASIEGDIAWYHQSIEYKWLATIVSAHVDLADPSYPFSETTGWVLRIRGSSQTAYEVKKRDDPKNDANNLKMAGT
jgi:hypothetical protein